MGASSYKVILKTYWVSCYMTKRSFTAHTTSISNFKKISGNTDSGVQHESWDSNSNPMCRCALKKVL